MIPELRALAEDDADVEGKTPPLPPRHEPEDLGMAGAWLQDTCQHLQRRRLAGAVRTDEGDALAGIDRESEIADRGDARRRRRPEQRAETPPAAGTGGADLEALGQPVY